MDSRAVISEDRLDSVDAGTRRESLEALCPEDRAQPPAPAGSGPRVNLHTHTFFSYHAQGQSPTHFAWRARKAGLDVAGIVDFDVLDGVDEFHEAGNLVGLKTVASIESRVFVPEFADLVISSPGEPGIAYHMGVGFVSSQVDPAGAPFLQRLRAGAERRTRELVHRVNAYLLPVALDYDADVKATTPSGNATERHVCEAYARKAASQFTEGDLPTYWESKLGDLPKDIDLPTGPVLQGLVRARTMKRGGVGYVQPDSDSFPHLAEMNRFVLQSNAIPTLTWLDGFSDGEQQIERLVDVGKASGVAALNLIPDRNFTPGVDDERLRNLHAVVELAQQHHLPVIVGTEMNSAGQKFADDFDAPELAPLVSVFLQGAHIVYAHTVLQRHGGMGYLSAWAARHFSDIAEKNVFFSEFGSRYQPGEEECLEGISERDHPARILDRVRQA